jgi:hypothetical protein
MPYGISLARVSQLLREHHDEWMQFTGEAIAARPYRLARVLITANRIRTWQYSMPPVHTERRHFVLPTKPLRPFPDYPLVVAYGLGVDSRTAMILTFPAIAG